MTESSNSIRTIVNRPKNRISLKSLEQTFVCRFCDAMVKAYFHYMDPGWIPGLRTVFLLH